MKYEHIHEGTFLERPNRFIAYAMLDGHRERVHVKNTGRCRELLTEGATVYLNRSDKPERSTAYDLVAVQKGEKLINMDSQAPNIAAREWLAAGGLGELHDLRWETVHGDSRFDFAFTRDGKPCFLEVKGVTLEDGGVCAFPDAPTERGTKHLHGLTRLVREGYGAYVLFVIQIEDVVSMHPNDETDPAFGTALREAAANGVRVLAVRCRVRPESMEIIGFVPVIMEER